MIFLALNFGASDLIFANFRKISILVPHLCDFMVPHKECHIYGSKSFLRKGLVWAFDSATFVRMPNKKQKCQTWMVGFSNSTQVSCRFSLKFWNSQSAFCVFCAMQLFIIPSHEIISGMAWLIVSLIWRSSFLTPEGNQGIFPSFIVV